MDTTPRRGYGCEVKGSVTPEREVRRLLLGLRSRHAVAAQPLARLLAELFRTPTEREGVIALIRDTFRGSGRNQTLLELVWKCDVEGTLSQTAVAGDLHLSPRQFFRYRKEAVQALAARIRDLLPSGTARQNPIHYFAELLAQVDPDAAARVLAEASPDERPSTHGALVLDVRMSAGREGNLGPIDLSNEPAEERVYVLLRLAGELYNFGQRDRADATIDLAMRIASTHRALSEPVLFQRALSAVLRARYYESSSHFSEQLETLIEVKKTFDSSSLGTLLLRSEAAIRRADIDEFERTMALCEPLILKRRELRLAALLLLSRAASLFMRGDFEKARATLAAALPAFEKRPSDWFIVDANRLRCETALGRWSQSTQPEVADLTIPHLNVGDGESMQVRCPWQFAYTKCYADFYHVRQDVLFRGASARALDDVERRCTQAGYVSLATAVAGARASASAREPGALDEVARSWFALASTAEAFLGFDAFVTADGASLLERLLERPAFRSDAFALLGRGAERAHWFDALQSAVRASARETERARGTVPESEASFWLSVLLPFSQRKAFRTAFDAALRRVTPLPSSRKSDAFAPFHQSAATQLSVR